MDILTDYKSQITKHSTAQVKTVGLLGDISDEELNERIKIGERLLKELK